MDSQNKTQFEHYAFISYSHRPKDLMAAIRLQHNLEWYKLPKTSRNELKDSKYLRDIWRDQTHLRGDVDEEIRKHLTLSKYLIIICSPHSAKSPYVNDEIDYYANVLNRGSHIIPYIISGEPNSGNDDTECFPKKLKEYNQLNGKNIYGYNINELGRSLAFVKVVAEMLDVDVESLWHRYKRDLRIRRIKLGVIASIIMLVAAYLLMPVKISFHLKDDTNAKLPEMRNAKLLINGNEYPITSKMLNVDIVDLSSWYRGRYIPVEFSATYYDTIRTNIKVGLFFLQDVDLILKRDNTFSIYEGDVFYDDGKRATFVEVNVGNHKTTTDSLGHFRIELPIRDQLTSQQVVIKKTGKIMFEEDDEWPRDSIRYILHREH